MSLAPRIADFGMAKLMARDSCRVVTTTRGTVGYLAPEWISRMPVTPKVDMYAYGMLLLENLSERMNSQEEWGSGTAALVYMGLPRMMVYWCCLLPDPGRTQASPGDVMSLGDRRLSGDAVPDEVERVCKVAC